MTANTQDFTSSGLKNEGTYENDRNYQNRDLFKAIIREVFGVADVICGHHLIYEVRDKRPDGFTYDVVQEIPSADALIFDHDIAKRLWGVNYKTILTQLACEPIATRDKLLASLYAARSK